MYRYLAAFFLLPASFFVHGTARSWVKAAFSGKRYFYSAIVRLAPERVGRSRSRIRNVLVYYPMKVGLFLLSSRSVKLTAANLAGRALGALTGKGTPQCAQAHDYWENHIRRIAPEHIRRMMREPAIRVVSFDVFDTLLVRPALHPKDILRIAAGRVKEVHGLDFIALRWDAEERLGKPDATIHDIYGWIQLQYGLAPETAAALMAEELRCEETLLSPRPDVKALHDEAVRLGKRVIAVSDMYLPGDFLGAVLQKKGCPVDAVYVSCDHGARKSDGALYDAVIAAEGVHPSEILHLGDNYQSDYVEAVGKKMTAVWYPSVFAGCFPDRRLYEALFGEAVRRDPLWSIYLGFTLNKLYGAPDKAPPNIADLRDLRHFALLALAPLTTAFCLFLATDKSIRDSYRTIHFASRDGWLPHKIYSSIRERLGGAPGVYFAAGRRAYYPFLYDSFFDFAASLQEAAESDEYTLGAFLQAYFPDSDLLSFLEKSLSHEEKSLLFFPDKTRCLDILRRFDR